MGDDQMSLFEGAMEKELNRNAPLSVRMRPLTLEEFAGQVTVVGAGTPLRMAIENDSLVSAIFFGPPGTGKTTLAMIIANLTRAHFESISAVTAGVADIKRVVKEAMDRLSFHQLRTILFIDEIHRFNKAQQDALLPHVEKGLVTLIGATTENPMFAVNRPLLSRTVLYRFELLNREEIIVLLNRALKDEIRGLGSYMVEVTREALEHLADVANGDARSALNALELAVLATAPGEHGLRRVSLARVEEAMQKRVLKYDRVNDHYDVISAFIKSMRGSDPQATLYWLARMLYAGEDPAYVSRRIMIHAAEDVGLADPRALMVATAAAQAVERIGMPEARIILAQAALYIATAPKSNAVVTGIDAALKAVEKEQAEPVPCYLRSTGYSGAAALGHGVGYKYPHDYPGHYVEQDYLPDNMKSMEFYRPSESGWEVEVGKRLSKKEQRRGKHGEKG